MKKLFKGLIKSVIMVLAILFLLAGLLFMTVSIGVFGPLPTKIELAGIHNEEASLVLASDGTLIGKYFAENRTNISWEEIPEHLTEALIATEDKRFYQHEGFDSRSYLRVFFKTILQGDRSSGGGSTLTQQLIKNLYGRTDHSLLSMPVNKLKEAILAARMEEVLTKEEVLLLYLNSVPFGEDVYGIEAASKRYYNKHANELNIQESAVLVGILKANTYYNPRKNPENAKRRRNQVLNLMLSEGFLDDVQCDSLKALSLELTYANYQKESPAGYFVYQVKKRLNQILENLTNKQGDGYDLEKDGLRVYTTLDIDLQKYARNAAKKQMDKMQKLLDSELKRLGKRKSWQKDLESRYGGQKTNKVKNREVFGWDGLKTKRMSYADSIWHYHSMLNAAILISEPSTGRVLTWVGGNHYRYLPYDMVFASRQLASAIKPFIYASALENGFTPCSYLKNEVVEYIDYDNWRPENYDKSSSQDTLIALWYALSKSMNLPTVDLYFQTGHKAVADMLRRLNFEVPVNEMPSLSLGTLDVSLYDIVKAYGTFANNGAIQSDLIMIDKITDAQGRIIYKADSQEAINIIQSDVTGQITSILEIAVNEGTGKQIRSRYRIKADIAGKTGTAQNYSDARFMAYTPNITIGVWVGARSPGVHFQSGLGSGSALALPIAGEILMDIEDNEVLRDKYLTDFYHENQFANLIDCDPYYEKGIAGFINRFADKDTNEEQVSVDTITEKAPDKEKKKSGFRRFFEKVFKGKNE